MTYSKDKLREALEKNRPSDFVKREVGEAWDVFPSKFSRVEIGILMDRYAREIIEALLDAPEGEGREGPRWISVQEIKRRMGLDLGASIPEGTVLAYRSRKQPHHNWHYGIYVENENKARDQFRPTECILIHWPAPQTMTDHEHH